MDPSDIPSAGSEIPAQSSAPTADVYAGDMAAPASVHSSVALLYLFDIRADPDPDVFSRVAGVFNIANVAPSGAELCRELDQIRISVAIELEGALVPEMIRRKLAQLTCVTSVELHVRAL